LGIVVVYEIPDSPYMIIHFLVVIR